MDIRTPYSEVDERTIASNPKVGAKRSYDASQRPDIQDVDAMKKEEEDLLREARSIYDNFRQHRAALDPEVSFVEALRSYAVLVQSTCAALTAKKYISLIIDYQGMVKALTAEERSRCFYVVKVLDRRATIQASEDEDLGHDDRDFSVRDLRLVLGELKPLYRHICVAVLLFGHRCADLTWIQLRQITSDEENIKTMIRRRSEEDHPRPPCLLVVDRDPPPKRKALLERLTIRILRQGRGFVEGLKDPQAEGESVYGT